MLVSYFTSTVQIARLQTVKSCGCRAVMAKERVVLHLMLDITKLLQPLGRHDRSSFYQYIQPVCFAAGWYTPEGVRPLLLHENEEIDVEHFVKKMGAAEATMLRGIYCKMIHDTDYPGDFLHDIAVCLYGRENIRPLRREMVALYNYNPFAFDLSQRNVLRLLYFICWGIRNGNIEQQHLVAIWKNLSMIQGNGRTSSCLCLPNKGRANYVKARERALLLVTDTSLRGLVDAMVVESHAGYIIGSTVMFKGYTNLIALISWDTMAR